MLTWYKIYWLAELYRGRGVGIRHVRSLPQRRHIPVLWRIAMRLAARRLVLVFYIHFLHRFRWQVTGSVLSARTRRMRSVSHYLTNLSLLPGDRRPVDALAKTNPVGNAPGNTQLVGLPSGHVDCSRYTIRVRFPANGRLRTTDSSYYKLSHMDWICKFYTRLPLQTLVTPLGRCRRPS